MYIVHYKHVIVKETLGDLYSVKNVACIVGWVLTGGHIFILIKL